MVEKTGEAQEAPEAPKDVRFMDKERRESMLLSARLLFGTMSGLWRSRGSDVLEPRLHRRASAALNRLSYAVRNGDTAAVSAALHFKDAAMRRREGRIARRLRERVNKSASQLSPSAAGGAGDDDADTAADRFFGREESDEWVDVERGNNDRSQSSKDPAVAAATATAGAAQAGDAGGTASVAALNPNHAAEDPAFSSSSSSTTSSEAVQWDARRFLAEPLAWLSSSWLDDDGIFSNGGLVAPHRKSLLSSSSSSLQPDVCVKMNYRSLTARGGGAIPPPLAMDSFARQLDRLHEGETTLVADQRSQLSQRWAEFCRDARLADRTATEAKDRLEKQGSLLTRHLEYLEVGSRQALDLEVEQCYLVGAKAWVACLRRLRVEWTPWFQQQHGNDGRGLLLTAADGDATQEETSKKIGWVMSEHEDSIGRRLLLVRNFDYADHAGASYRDVKEARNAALLTKTKPAALSGGEGGSATAAAASSPGRLGTRRTMELATDFLNARECVLTPWSGDSS